MKYSVNGGKIYKLPDCLASEEMFKHSYQIAEAVGDFWYWDNFDGRAEQPQEYLIKLYTDEGKLIQSFTVEIDYSPSFNAYLLEEKE